MVVADRYSRSGALPRLNSRSPALLIPLAFAAAALAARALMPSVPARFEIDLAAPLVVVTNWGAFGAVLFGVLFLALGGASLAYRSLVCRRTPLSLAALATLSGLAIAAAWCAPVLFSSDVYAYAAYGELARLGIDPYLLAPVHRSDPLLGVAAWQWGNAIPMCVYGPAFVGLSRAIVTTFAPFGTLAQLDALRLLASAAFVFCAPLACAAFPGGRRARLGAAATIALNPLAIWCAAEGHNDAIALAIVLAGFALTQRGFFGVGPAVIAFSALVKVPGALAALAVATLHRRFRVGAAVGIGLAGLLSVPLLVGVATRLAPQGHYTAQASLQAIVEPLGPLVALLAAAGIAAVLAANGIRRLRCGQIEGWLWLGLAVWVLIPNPYPWYGIWLVALAALAPRSRAANVAILLSFVAVLRYVPDAIGMPSAALGVILGLVAASPLLGLRYNERLA